MDIAKATEYCYVGMLGGVRLRFAFRFPETAGFLAPYVAPDDTGDGARVRVSDGDWDQWFATGRQRDAFGEFSTLSIAASDALMEHDRFLFHAAAIRFRDQAWLITAGSGVGKSTQIKTLRELYPGEVSVICGDRPIIRCAADGTAMVYPSPWNGKENWHGAPSAPLGGIILLRRGKENIIRSLKPKDAAAPVFTSIFSSCDSETSLYRVSAAAERLLRAAPIWELTNRGVPDSTRLLYDTMLQES